MNKSRILQTTCLVMALPSVVAYPLQNARPAQAGAPAEYSTGAAGDETYTGTAGTIMTFGSSDIVVPNTCTGTRPGGTATACYDRRDRIYVVGGACEKPRQVFTCWGHAHHGPQGCRTIVCPPVYRRHLCGPPFTVVLQRESF